MSSPYPKGKMPAHPPEDYTGTQADWLTALWERGILTEDFDGWYGDIIIDDEIYCEILKECEDK